MRIPFRGRRDIANFIFFLSHATTIVLFGQDSDSFEFLSIDRPDVSNLPTTIRPGHFQFEVGLEFGKNDFLKEYSLPNFLLRTGLGKKLELRLGVSHLQLDSNESVSPDAFVINSVSFKYRLLEEKGIRPSIALQPEVIFGFREGPDAKNPNVDYGLILLFNNTIHEKIFINYNAGLFAFREKVKEYLLSISVSFMHTHRLGYFLETYEISDDIDLNLSVDGGITYLVKPRLQLDMYIGKQDLLSSDRVYFGLGMGVRLDKGDVKPKTFKDIGIHH